MKLDKNWRENRGMFIYTHTWCNIYCITRANQSVKAYPLEYIITGVVYYSKRVRTGGSMMHVYRHTFCQQAPFFLLTL